VAAGKRINLLADLVAFISKKATQSGSVRPLTCMIQHKLGLLPLLPHGESPLSKAQVHAHSTDSRVIADCPVLHNIPHGRPAGCCNHTVTGTPGGGGIVCLQHRSPPDVTIVLLSVAAGLKGEQQGLLEARMDLWLVVLLLLEPQVQGELRVSGDIHDRTLTWDGAVWHRTAHQRGSILSGPVPTDCTVIPSTKLLSTAAASTLLVGAAAPRSVCCVCPSPLHIRFIGQPCLDIAAL
jgi:hypothetical protein